MAKTLAVACFGIATLAWLASAVYRSGYEFVLPF